VRGKHRLLRRQKTQKSRFFRPFSKMSSSMTGDTERPSAEKDVFVFPNPAFGTIRLSQHVIGSRYQLIDASGSVLEKGVLMENQIDCHSRPAGIYTLLIERPDGIFRALRFVLMK